MLPKKIQKSTFRFQCCCIFGVLFAYHSQEIKIKGTFYLRNNFVLQTQNEIHTYSNEVFCHSSTQSGQEVGKGRAFPGEEMRGTNRNLSDELILHMFEKRFYKKGRPSGEKKKKLITAL